LEGPSDCGDGRYSEFGNEWLVVDIVTVEDPEELFITLCEQILRTFCKIVDDLNTTDLTVLEPRPWQSQPRLVAEHRLFRDPLAPVLVYNAAKIAPYELAFPGCLVSLALGGVINNIWPNAK
jgi:hypothetical protein